MENKEGKCDVFSVGGCFCSVNNLQKQLVDLTLFLHVFLHSFCSNFALDFLQCPPAPPTDFVAS